MSRPISGPGLPNGRRTPPEEIHDRARFEPPDRRHQPAPPAPGRGPGRGSGRSSPPVDRPGAASPARRPPRRPPRPRPRRPAARPPPPSTGQLGGKLNFANWTAYIDLTVDPGADGQAGTDDDAYVLPSPTLDQFTQATGIEVNYKEAVNDNEEFFGTDLQGPLSQNQPTGWDLIVMTDWMAGPAHPARLGRDDRHDRDDELPDEPRGRLPGPDVRPRGEDDRPVAVGDDRHRLRQRRRPASSTASTRSGTRSTRARSTTSPRCATRSACRRSGSASTRRRSPTTQFDQALAEIKKAIDSKLVRTIKGNDYLTDLASGDVVVSMAWSGDIVQLALDKADPQVRGRQGRRHALDRQHDDPEGRAEQEAGRGVHRLLLRPGDRRPGRGLRELRLSGQGRQGGAPRDQPRQRQQPADLPAADVLARVKVFRGLDEATEKKYLNAWNTVIGL